MNVTIKNSALSPALVTALLLLSFLANAQDRLMQNTTLYNAQETPVNPISPFFHNNIIKLDLAGLHPQTRRELALEFDRPVNNKASFSLQFANEWMNGSVANQAPGAYFHTVEEVKSTTLLFFVPVTTLTYTKEKPFQEWGPFMPRTVFKISPSFKLFFSDDVNHGRLYIQPGLRFHIARGVTQEITRRTVSQSHEVLGFQNFIGFGDSVTDTKVYEESMTVTGGVTKVSSGIFAGFGYQNGLQNKCNVDIRGEIGVRSGDKWTGYGKWQFPLRIQLGYRF